MKDNFKYLIFLIIGAVVGIAIFYGITKGNDLPYRVFLEDDYITIRDDNQKEQFSFKNIEYMNSYYFGYSSFIANQEHIPLILIVGSDDSNKNTLLSNTPNKVIETIRELYIKDFDPEADDNLVFLSLDEKQVKINGTEFIKVTGEVKKNNVPEDGKTITVYHGDFVSYFFVVNDIPSYLFLMGGITSKAEIDIIAREIINTLKFS